MKANEETNSATPPFSTAEFEGDGERLLVASSRKSPKQPPLSAAFDRSRRGHERRSEEAQRGCLPLQFASPTGSCEETAIDWAFERTGRWRSAERCLNSVFSRMNDLLDEEEVDGGVAVECAACKRATCTKRTEKRSRRFNQNAQVGVTNKRTNGTSGLVDWNETERKDRSAMQTNTPTAAPIRPPVASSKGLPRDGP